MLGLKDHDTIIKLVGLGLSHLVEYPYLDTIRTPTHYPELTPLIIVDQPLHSNPSLGMNLMRAYAARGKTSITGNIYNEIPVKNIFFFNVMIRSYVSNHVYHDALFSKPWLARDLSLIILYILVCCKRIHGAVVKVGLDLNFFYEE